MAYMIGQLRKENFGLSNAFMTSVSVTPVIIKSASPYVNMEGLTTEGYNSDFDDLALSVNSDNEGNGKFLINETYFFRCSIEQPMLIDDNNASYNQNPTIWKDKAAQNRLTITVELRDDTENGEKTTLQTIETFVVPPRITNQKSYYTYSIVFTPLQTCKYLVLKLNRIGYDVLQTPRSWLIDGIQGASTNLTHVLLTGQHGEVSKLKNIIGSNPSSWLRFGFQSRPGTQIVVNQSPVRVGRSGTFELNIDMNINSFMIAAPQGVNSNNVDPFLLDYAYETTS